MMETLLEKVKVNMSPPFYTASRIDFTLATLKFDSCGAEVLH